MSTSVIKSKDSTKKLDAADANFEEITDELLEQLTH